jgi:hypothetical protein
MPDFEECVKAYTSSQDADAAIRFMPSPASVRRPEARFADVEEEARRANCLGIECRK